MEPKSRQFNKVTNLLDHKIRKTTPFGPLASGLIKHSDVKAQEAAQKNS